MARLVCGVGSATTGPYALGTLHTTSHDFHHEVKENIHRSLCPSWLHLFGEPHIHLELKSQHIRKQGMRSGMEASGKA